MPQPGHRGCSIHSESCIVVPGSTDTSYARFELVIAAAVELDAMAAAGGIETIAPLYGLCIPMKGTASVVDFPSGSGVGILSGYTPVDDSELTKLIKERHGVIS